MRPAITWLRHRSRLLAGIGALVLVACGGSDSTQNFATCGNSRLDDGERCDDGNLNDTDACTTACQVARCGDGVVEVGIEQCDGRDLRGGTCATLGLQGRPVCDGGCRFDYSVCGAPIPTPTVTRTPAPPTATPTATPASSCGDGLLDSDETCESCAADCTAQACVPIATTVGVRVSLSLPASGIAQARVQLAYRTSIVSLPASGLQQRFQAAPGNVVRPTDRDYAVDVLVARTGGLMSGAIFTATFDTCADAGPADDRDFVCTVTNCGTASDCTCSAELL